jgi:phosphate-selective porin OprO/OprP
MTSRLRKLTLTYDDTLNDILEYGVTKNYQPQAWAAILLTGLTCMAPVLRAAAADTGDLAAEAAALRSLIEQLDQRLKSLEHRLEIQRSTAPVAAAAPEARAEPAARAASGARAEPSRFSVTSSDGTSSVRLRAVLSLDDRMFQNSPAPNGSPLAQGTNTFLVRQIRPIVEGSLGKLIDFRIVPDFGSGRAIVQDAYMVAKFKPWFNLTAGKFKSPFGLERLQLDTDTRFVERALPNNLVPGRDVGLQIGGELLGGVISYQVAYLNGTLDGRSSDNNSSPDADNNNAKDFVLRVFTLPFQNTSLLGLRGLGLGMAASRSHANGQVDASGAATNSLLSSYVTDGQQTFFGYRGGTTPTLAWGDHKRFSPQAYYYDGPFGALAEYVSDDQDVRRAKGASVKLASLSHSAWQLSVSWFASGETNGYRVPLPLRPYAVGAPGWGALELTARIAALDIDNSAFMGGANSFANPVGSARRAQAYALGANWALTQNFKLLFDYEQTHFTGGGTGGGDAPAERLIFTRFQLQY